MLMSRDGMSGRRRAALGALALGVALLGGCQSNPEPPPIEAAPSSLPPSPSPSETAPTLPAEAKGASEAAAKAFVRYYFATLNHAMISGDTEHFRELSTSECESCSAIARNIDGTYAAGGRIESKGWLVRSVSLVPGQPKASPIVDLGIFMSEERVTERAGSSPKSFEGGKQPMTMYLIRANDQWRVSRLDRVA